MSLQDERNALLRAEFAAFVQGELPKDAQGQPVPVPKVADLIDYFTKQDATVKQLVAGLNTANTTIASQADTITQLQSQLRDKANAATVQGISQTLGTVADKVNHPTTGLAATNTLASTAKSTADINAAALPALAKSADVATALTGKVDASALATTNTNVAAAKATADAAKATADANTTALTGKASTADLTAGLALKVAKAGDTVTGPLGVPVAAGMDKAVQKSELVGGIQRPYRVFQNVGTAAVGAYVRPGQAAAVTDALGLGQVFTPTIFRLKTVTAPTLASTVTLYVNGSPFYSTTVALAQIPAVGKTVDLLSLTGMSLPPDITLPATLTVAASAGTFEILLDGVLK